MSLQVAHESHPSIDREEEKVVQLHEVNELEGIQGSNVSLIG